MLVAVGLAVGLAGAAVATRALESMLVGVEPFDPLTYLSAAGLMLLTASAASIIPTVRATRVDPASVLRAQ